MAEWFKAIVLKTVVRKKYHGFEPNSLPCCSYKAETVFCSQMET